MNRIAPLVVGVIAFAFTAGTSQAAPTPPIAVSGEIVAGEFGASDPAWSDLTIDRVTFDVAGPGAVYFDLLVWENIGFDTNGDGEYTSADAQVRLFKADNTYLAQNDDGGLGFDGSISGLDPYLGYSFTSAGTYYLAISRLSFSEAEAVAGFAPDRLFPVDTSYHFDWRLTLSSPDVEVSNLVVSTLGSPAPVPEPASLALGALGSVALLRRKRS